MANEYLFVYGTLKSSFKLPQFDQIKQYTQFISVARYQGTLFNVDGYPGVVPSTNPSDSVYGEVYLLSDANRLLNILDEYEECSPHFPEPTEYIRTPQLIHLNDNTIIEAWIYLYNHKTHNLVRITSGCFIGYL